MDTWVLQMCRRSSARQLMAWAAALVVVALAWSANATYVRGFVLGPRAVAAADLGRVRVPDGTARFYVKVDGSRTFETGLREVAVKTRNGAEVSRSVSATYYGVQVGDRVLLVKSPRAVGTSVEGRLGPMPEDFQREYFSTPEAEARRHQFYPFYLDASSFRTPGYWGIGLTLAFLALLAWKARPAWRRYQRPETHPVSERVARWGEPVTISGEVERELQAPDNLRAGRWRMTDRYLVSRSLLGFDLLRLRDLLWAYKKVTKNSINFIPTGKTYAVVMACYGGTAELPGREARCDELIAKASSRAPWAVIGYTKELADAFRRDYQGFCRAVEARRQPGGVAGDPSAAG